MLYPGSRSLTERLKSLLASIQVLDDRERYDDRNCTVIMAVGIAQAVGMKAGFRIDPEEPDWPVAFIELPTGQVSWHLPQHEQAWDQHTTVQKNLRIARYLEGTDA